MMAHQVKDRMTMASNEFGVSLAISAAPELVPLLLPSLPGGWHAVDGEADFAVTYSVEEMATNEESQAGRFQLLVDGQPTFSVDEIDGLRWHLESHVHHFVATHTQGFLFVHAGVVATGQRTLVVPGRSFTGKTTLVRALLERGATYFSDDYAIVDDQGLIHPFPRQLRIRAGSGKWRERLDPVERDWPVGSGPLPLGLLADVRYDHLVGWDVAEVSPGLGALTLLDNTVAARIRPVDSLTVMTRAMTTARAIEGTRGEAADAAERLLRVMTGTS
jgi:hypothetical protein